MKILALDSSGPIVSLGVADDRNILAESQFATGNKIVGLLTPEIEKILTEAGVHPAKPEGFALGAGPGSFTGLKVGFAAIMGLAFNGEKPIWTFPSLKLTALGLALSAEFKKGVSNLTANQPVAFKTNAGGLNLDFAKGASQKEKPVLSKILVLTGAKKGYFYRDMFVWAKNGIEEFEPLEAQKIEELAWPEEPVWVTGSALETGRAEVMGRVRPEDRVASKDFWHPPAGLLAQLAATGKLGNPAGRDDTLEPFFLKSFETKFKEIS
jgi:tRNA threonylcarbamoyl adenosine modification protein YeaZ